MESATAENSRGAKRRASRACSFCRQRKLRCDNQQPKCANCNTYQKQCTYETTSKKARLSTQIEDLEAENRRLKERLQVPLENEASRTDSRMSEPLRTTSHIQRQESFPTTTTNKSSGNVPSQSSVPLNYYGLTSTLFDDNSNDPKGSRKIHADPRMPVEWVQKGLVAEATRQRQLESLNYNARKLDFDGVDPELGMHLLSLHWNRQHHSFLITYRPAFMRDMACGGPYFSKILLNAIYFAASKFSTRLELRQDPEDVRTAGLVYRRRVKELLGEALDTSEITTIQALLVMTNSLFALGDERSASWLYAGIALRMLVELGLHVDSEDLSLTRRFTDEDIEIRRRVFWAAFVVDKIQSLYQGRPASLQDFDSRVPLSFFDKYEELEPWTPFAYAGNQDYPGSPAYSVSTFSELCKLCVILNQILNKIYSEKAKKRKSRKLLDSQESIHAELEGWRAKLPAHLDFNPLDPNTLTPPPHVLSLLAMHNVLLILLHRPFVEDGHLYSEEPTIAVKAFAICSKAAKTICHLVHRYDSTFSVRRAPYLIPYATYVAATIHVRVAAQKRPGSDAHVALHTCLRVFNENQETNWAVRRAKFVIVNLMKRMKISLSEFGDTELRGWKDQVEPTGIRPVDHQVPSDYTGGSNGRMDPTNRSSLSSVTSAEVLEPPHNPTTPELDIEMIVQSFLHDQNQNPQQPLLFQQAVPPGQLPPSIPLSRGYDPAVDPTTSLPQQTFNSTAPGTSTNAAAYQVGNSVISNFDSFNPSYNIDDLLFGFNGAAQDELWMENVGFDGTENLEYSGGNVTM